MPRVLGARLWFVENCCIGRHFQVALQGEIVAEDISYLDYAAEPALGRPGWLEFPEASP